jgi:predicted nucleic acid-binding protein
VIILDTNVLSALMHRSPDQKVAAWLDRQPPSSVWTTSITVLEIRFGLQILPSGKRRTLLVEAFDALLEQMSQRVVPFDVTAADHAANLMATRRNKGRPVDLRDTMIAGIVVAQRAALATRNVSHFGDIPATVVNPWTA